MNKILDLADIYILTNKEKLQELKTTEIVGLYAPVFLGSPTIDENKIVGPDKLPGLKNLVASRKNQYQGVAKIDPKDHHILKMVN